MTDGMSSHDDIQSQRCLPFLDASILNRRVGTYGARLTPTHLLLHLLLVSRRATFASLD